MGVRNKKEDGKIPGPGNYDTNKSTLFDQKITIKGRKLENTQNKLLLGPGQYNIKPEIGTNNSSFSSKFKKQSAFRIMKPIKINPRNSVEKTELKSEIQKDFSYQINKDGQYFNSKYKNPPQVKICLPNFKDHFKSVQIPGPGSYQQPSEFGIYLSSLAVSR